MNRLLARKDVRILRPAMLAAVLLAALLEVALPLLSTYIDYSRYHGLGGDRAMVADVLARGFWGSVANGAYVAIILTTGLAAVLGGASVTIERRERWGEFAAMLPVSRRRRTFISLATGATLFGACWLVHLAILLIAVPHTGSATVVLPWLLATIAGFAVGTFGIAWLLSSLLRSAAIVASTTLGLVVGGLFVAWTLDGLLGATDGSQPSAAWNPGRFVPTYTATLVAIGVIGCIAGTLLASRRVEP